VKLLHTSDLRIGLAFARQYQRAPILREARLEALRSLLALARREEVSAVLLTGNTLASPYIDHKLLLELLSVLGTSPAPVYLSPGELDPLTADSPYALRADLFQPPVHILRGAALPWDGPLVSLVADPQAAYVAQPIASPEAYDYGQPLGKVRLVRFPGPQIEEIECGRHRWLDFRGSVEEACAQLRQGRDNTLLRLHVEGTATVEQIQEFGQLRTQTRLFHLEVVEEPELRLSASYNHPLLQALQQQVAGNSQALLTLHTLVNASQKEDLV